MQYGIVGFGVSLYQDLCCQACHDSLTSLYLNCSIFDTDSGMSDMDMNDMGVDMPMGTTSDECYATNIPWLQTMAYCIQQNCNADGYPSEKQATCFSHQAVAGASEPTFEDSLPANAPTLELPDDAMWLNMTSLVNHDLYYSTHGTLGEFARSEYLHTTYSLILYLIVIGICIGCGILNHIMSTFPRLQKLLQTSKHWTKLRRLIWLPALFESRRLEPLPSQLGYVPSRALSIFIFVYIVLNVILSSISFQSFQPNIWFMSSGFEFCEYVGNRTGILSFVNTSIAILFAGRNNILIVVTGWSQSAFLTLHRWAARVATVQAVVHSIVYTLAYFEPGYDGASAYSAKAAEPFYWWGILATIAFCLAAGFAMLPFRIRFYETFLILHIVLVVLALVGCWYHVVPHFGYDYGYQVWLYLAFAFWAVDRVVRFARIVYYNRIGSSKAIVQAIPDSGIMQITVFPRTLRGFGPGQHSFLYFLGVGKAWESHPFSVASWKQEGQALPAAHSSVSGSKNDDETIYETTTQAMALNETETRCRASIRFLVRAHSGTTASLRRRLLASSPQHSIEVSVYNEGPYAGHRATLQPLLLADTVLCLAGGIGITNALGFIHAYTLANLREGKPSGNTHGIMRNTKRFILDWSAREISLIVHVKQNFLTDLEGIEYHFWCTGTSDTSVPKAESFKEEGQQSRSPATPAIPVINTGRMDVGTVIRSSVEVGHQTTVLVCGPGGMADEATREVVSCVKDGFDVDLVEEAYTW
ncbi:ferric reductase like transmembrane component-domain-containing protein [Truncatella angustata]|uniref:Ferric reductase like transmembrane component-domain-containing protein n=1 Tax=Truncatella angustata TaxID=152316 RepID=A0A9P8UAI1_9PEZI|nr:ferric reductase like transmembrane component-domain-containing protein [Truncatella angustata]KAH6643451.1 ferric reductase like transmembrane component-domain-containing protein [Truncatella angustata]